MQFNERINLDFGVADLGCYSFDGNVIVEESHYLMEVFYECPNTTHIYVYRTNRARSSSNQNHHL